MLIPCAEHCAALMLISKTQQADTKWGLLENELRGFGFEVGWGRDAARGFRSLQLLMDLFEAPSPDALEAFLRSYTDDFLSGDYVSARLVRSSGCAGAGRIPVDRLSIFSTRCVL